MQILAILVISQYQLTMQKLELPNENARETGDGQLRYTGDNQIREVGSNEN